MSLDVSRRRADLLADLASLPTLEERLEWVCDRKPWSSPLEDAELAEELRIRECVSPLWLLATEHAGRCSFRMRAGSKVVGGVTAFLCDYFSGMTAAETLSERGRVVESLRFEEMLGVTRRLTVARVVTRICEFAAEVERRGNPPDVC